MGGEESRAQKIFALIFREESTRNARRNHIRFLPRDHAAGKWEGRIWKIFGTRQKRGFTKGRSLVVFLAFGIWFFKLKLVKSLLGADPDSVRPVVA